MKRYTVTEVFSTLQGEGAQAGTPAVFVRFTGCNAWNGLPESRERDATRTGAACARWCDTYFATGDRMSAEDVVAAVVKAAAESPPGPRLVVCTGGEPLLQLDRELCAALQTAGFRVAIETNGSIDKDVGADWVCVSPKWMDARWRLRRGDELKIVWPTFTVEGVLTEHPDVVGSFTHLFLQPQDGPNGATVTAAAVAEVARVQGWRLSLQTHKLLGLR